MYAAFPNEQTKQPGDYVRNVHPCSQYGRDELGLVLMCDELAGGSVYVRTGRGSTCYGPARNWELVDVKPRWLEELERERELEELGSPATLEELERMNETRPAYPPRAFDPVVPERCRLHDRYDDCEATG